LDHSNQTLSYFLLKNNIAGETILTRCITFLNSTYSTSESPLYARNCFLFPKFFQALQDLPEYKSNIFIIVRYRPDIDGQPRPVIPYNEELLNEIGFFFEGGKDQPELFRLS
jgi:hypothetical protein